MAKQSFLAVVDREVKVSNLDKILYPVTGFTKRDVIDYYVNVSSVLLPHLKDRPISPIFTDSFGDRGYDPFPTYHCS